MCTYSLLVYLVGLDILYFTIYVFRDHHLLSWSEYPSCPIGIQHSTRDSISEQRYDRWGQEKLSYMLNDPKGQFNFNLHVHF